MYLKRRAQYEQGLKQLDIVPLVNIVFLLLIFILLIVGFMGLPGIKINFPGLVTNSVLTSRNVEIVLNENGGILFQGKPILSAELKRMLTQFPMERTAVLIKADKSVSLANVMRVWQICQEVGLRQVNIAAAIERK